MIARAELAARRRSRARDALICRGAVRYFGLPEGRARSVLGLWRRRWGRAPLYLPRRFGYQGGTDGR